MWKCQRPEIRDFASTHESVLGITKAKWLLLSLRLHSLDLVQLVYNDLAGAGQRHVLDLWR